VSAGPELVETGALRFAGFLGCPCSRRFEYLEWARRTDEVQVRSTWLA